MKSKLQWYEVAINDPSSGIITSKGVKYVYYKGFRISEHLEIVDIRDNDFYGQVSKEDYKVFMSLGFITGACFLMYNRDALRTINYRRKLENWKALHISFQEKQRLHPESAFYRKRVRNCETNIAALEELIDFYQSRHEALQQKYKFE